MTRLIIIFIWLLHWLPLPLQAAVGWLLGQLLYLLIVPRRRVVHINLALCFPEKSPAERRRMARAVFVAVTRCMLERGVMWWGSAERIRRLVDLTGLEHIHAAQAAGKSVILLVPHFVALDMAGTRLAMERDCVSIYAAQNNKLLEKMLLLGRTRFGSQVLLSRQDGVRATVKAMKSGRPFYYLPDLDYGKRDAIFVPFFGVPTATISGLSRLAKLSNAVVIPLIARMKPYAAGYSCEIGAPWADFPSEDIAFDTRRMNAFIEEEVRQMPAQYYWVHKRFKTRPEGEARFY